MPTTRGNDDAHSGHFGSSSWVPSLWGCCPSPARTCPVLNFLFFLPVQISFHTGPRTRKREITKTISQHPLEFWGIVHLEPLMEKSLLGERHTSLFLLYPVFPQPPFWKSIFVSQTQPYSLGRVTKGWPFPLSHWFRGQKKQNRTETVSGHEVPNVTPLQSFL